MSGPFTMAQNFTSSVDRDIDPRTGQFKPVINLGEIKGNSGAGPQLPITLVYSPYNSINQGLGIGWSISVASFDSDNRVLSHPNGSNWALDGEHSSSGYYSLKHQKVKDFILKDAGDGNYCIWNSSGDAVIISPTNYIIGNNHCQLATMMFNASGDQISFEFDPSGRISKILDGDKSELMTTMYAGSTTTIILFPQTKFKKTYNFTIQNSYLTQISCDTEENGTIYWTLESGTNSDNLTNVAFGGNNALLSIKYPTGVKHSVVYNVNSDALISPDGTYIPCIKSSVTDHAGGQPPIRKNYIYDDQRRNYLGYGSGLSSTSLNDDLLYTCNDNDYNYNVTEIVLNESLEEAFRTTYTYNKYHLLASECFKDAQNNAKRTTTNTYDASLFNGTDHDDLPTWFQNPVDVTVITEAVVDGINQVKSLTRHYEYYGSESNYCEGLIKSQTFANQKKVSYEYYRADGTEPGCERNPHVIASDPAGWPSNYHKSITVSDISEAETEMLRLEFDYKSLGKKANASQYFPSISYLAQSEVRLFTAQQYIIQKQYKYDEDNSSISFGNINGIYINSVNQNGNQNTNNREFVPVKSEEYSYEFTDVNDAKNPNSIIKTTVSKGLYNTTEKDYICKFRGVLLESLDAYGNTHTFKYGTTNALVEESYKSIDTFYQTVTKHSYGSRTENGTDYFNTLETVLTLSNPGQGLSDVIHSGQFQWLDGAERQIRLAQAPGSTDGTGSQLDYKDIALNSFNYFGEAKSVTSLDRLPTIDSTEPSNASAVKNNIYDAFRKLSGYEFLNADSEAHIIQSIFNPSNISTSYSDNCVNQTRKKEVNIDESNVTDTIFSVDGITELHNVIHQFSKYGPLASIMETVTGQTGNEPSIYNYGFTNDALGRPTSKTYGDGSVMKLEYDSRFYKPLITKVILCASENATPKTILECAYDERGLILKKSLTGRDLSYRAYHSYEYDRNYPRIITKTQPDRKTTFKFSYNDNIGGKVSSIKTSDNIEKIFNYNSLGQLISAVENNNNSLSFATERTVDSLGRTVAENYKIPGKDKYANIAISYSDGNSKVTSFTDANGLTTYNYYNSAMQLVRTENKFMRAEFVYDTAARVIQKNTWNIKSFDNASQKGIPDESTKITSEYNYDLGNGDLKTIYESSGGTLKCTIAMTYRSDGLLKSRTYTPGNSTQSYNRKETFTYDARKRLLNYTCSGSNLIKNSDGNSIQRQSFIYDNYNNILSISSICSSGKSSYPTGISFTYSNENPFLLTSVIKGNGAPITIRYDDDFDRALNDDQGRTFTYDSFERVSSASLNGISTVFWYDALDAMRIQTNTNKERRNLFYAGNSIVSEYTESGITRKNIISRMYSENGYLGQTNNVWQSFAAVPVDGSDNPIFTDAKSFELSSGTTPFGDSNQVSTSVPSYRGEIYNDALGGYFLGKGYRIYNPRLGRFSSPDSLDPHTKAGINPFGYAHNDPINYSDPDGHAPQTTSRSKHLGLYLGFMGAAVIGLSLMTVAGVATGGVGLGFLMATGPQIAFYTLSMGAATYAFIEQNKNPGDAKIARTIAFVSLGIAGMSTFGKFSAVMDKKAADELAEQEKEKALRKLAKEREAEHANKVATDISRSNSIKSHQDLSFKNSITHEEMHSSDKRRSISDFSSISSEEGSNKTRIIPDVPGTEFNQAANDAIDNFIGNTPISPYDNFSFSSAYPSSEDIRSPVTSSISDEESERPIVPPRGGSLYQESPVPPQYQNPSGNKRDELIKELSNFPIESLRKVVR